MAEKTIKSRLQMKTDTEANWKKAINFVPKTGEIIIYAVDDTHNAPRIKVGDNVSNVNDLPFLYSESGDTPTPIITSSSEFVISTNIEASAALTGESKIKELEDGQQFIYFNKYECPGTALTLNLTLSDGNETGSIPIYNYSEIPCSIPYPANCVIQLVYCNSAFYLINNNISIVI